ncbi:glycosyltransferase [Allocoleopsis sp.]|uniref:glycosyltransferase n=1 Tax=Allocoleopsis sp. TaxID=3088169 RepID=UPI002FCFF758
MSLISVIIPVFNGENTIKETIKSVLTQTCSDLEIIIINDGSQDSSLNIVSSLKDSRIKVFSYDNAGISTSRNRGFFHSSGEFISFLDADDLWTPDKLEAQFKALQANPEAAVAYSWVNYIDESGQFFRVGNHQTLNGNVYEKLLVQNLLENGSNPLIRRQALTEVGGFDPAFSSAADWDMWLRLAARYPFVVVPSPQILYRMSGSSMSSNILKMEAECLQLIEKAFNQAPASLKFLEKNSLGALYNYLTFKVLEGSSKRQNAILAARFFGQLVRNDPSVLRRPKPMLTALFKIPVVLFLPPQQSHALINTAKKVLIN